MLDPGTALAIVSLALQVSRGRYAYYELWQDCGKDVLELRHSLLRLTDIFKQLEITLQKPHMKESLVSTICLTTRACERSVDELHAMLDKVKRDGPAVGIIEQLRAKGRRACYPFRASTISRLSEIIDDLKDDLALAVGVLSLDTTASTLHELDMVSSNLGAMGIKIECINEIIDLKWKEEQHIKALEWLAPPDHSSPHNHTCDKRQPGTGNWFIESPAFLNWWRQPSSRMWLYGSVGCGKTVLCSTIIEKVKKLSSDEIMRGRPHHVAYFYFSFDDAPSQDLGTFLRSIIAQLCPREEILPELRSLFIRRYPTRPSCKDLRMTLISILKRFGGKPDNLLDSATNVKKISETFLIFDGLDEIPYGSPRDDILGLLGEISTTPTAEHIHILVTGRGEKDISDGLPSSQGWWHYGIGRSRVEDDIAIYASCQIAAHQKLNALPDRIKVKIKERLIQGSKGMFRWAALQMEDLRRLKLIRPCDIVKVLDTLPRDLNTTYDRILARIDTLYSQEAFTALQWLTFAARPLYIEEVAEACIIDPKAAVPVDPDRQMSPLDIADILCGLVVIEPALKDAKTLRPQTHILGLAHFSVKEYLVSGRSHTQAANTYRLEAGLAHSFITTSCMAYLFHCHARLHTISPDSLPLREYACNRWAEHTSLIPSDLSKQATLSVLAMFNMRKVCLYWIQHSQLHWTSQAGFSSAAYSLSPYYAANSTGFTDSELLKFYPLYHSTAYRLFEVARLLLENHVAADFFSPHGCVLEVAVMMEDMRMIRLLLQHGANQHGALKRALSGRKNDVAIHLLSCGCRAKGEDVAVAAAHCSPAVMRAVIRTTPTVSKITLIRALDAGLASLNRATVRVLFEEVVFLNHKLLQYSNRALLYYQLLRVATRLGLHLAIGFLLHNENRFPSFLYSYTKIFHMALRYQYHDVVRVLLNSHAKSKIHYQAFLHAVKRANVEKHYNVFCALLPHMFKGDNRPSKQLQVAIALDKQEIFTELVCRGAGLTSDGVWVDDRALLMAALRDNKYMVKVLRSSGADVQLCEALMDKRVRRDVAEFLYSSGSTFPICSLSAATTRCPGRWPRLQQVYQCVAQARHYYERRKQRYLTVKWSFKRVLDIVDKTFSVKNGNTWFFGSDDIRDLKPWKADGQSSSILQKAPVLIIHRYMSVSTGRTWKFFPSDTPKTAWVGCVLEVELLNGQESGWEDVLYSLGGIRSSIGYYNVSKYKRFFPEISWPSEYENSSKEQVWGNILQSAFSICGLFQYLILGYPFQVFAADLRGVGPGLWVLDEDCDPERDNYSHDGQNRVLELDDDCNSEPNISPPSSPQSNTIIPV